MPTSHRSSQPTRVGVTSVHEFSAAHRLPYHNGKCKREHGHNYTVEFTRYGEPQPYSSCEAGMVVDFANFDAEIKGVLEILDHYRLNEDVGIPNPTAENLALWLLDHLPHVDKVVVWETSRHCAHAERVRQADPAPEPQGVSLSSKEGEHLTIKIVHSHETV